MGNGCEGIVYLTPRGHALKIFKSDKKCMKEYFILKSVEGSACFPKVLKYNSKCILREYVAGLQLNEYLKKNGLSEKLAINLINLIEEFKRLNFKRLDIRGAHVFVQVDESIKVIDPRKSYTKEKLIPYNLIKTIDKCNALDDFIKVLITYRIDLAVKWQKALIK